MLVTYTHALYPVGIAITQWKVEGKLRTFVLYPIMKGDRHYVEIDCVTEEDGRLTIIQPQRAAWQKISNGFGETSFGYPFDDQTREMLYHVWDDGAFAHIQQAEALYTRYDELIRSYAREVQRYAEELYRQRVHEASTRGWDTSLLEKPPFHFPYLADDPFQFPS